MNKHLSEITVTVMKQTEKSLQEAANETGLTMGVIIDRLTQTYMPEDPELAIQLAEENLLLTMSHLPESELQSTYFKFLADIIVLLFPNENLVQELIECGKKRLEDLKEEIKELSNESESQLAADTGK